MCTQIVLSLRSVADTLAEQKMFETKEVMGVTAAHTVDLAEMANRKERPGPVECLVPRWHSFFPADSSNQHETNVLHCHCISQQNCHLFGTNACA